MTTFTPRPQWIVDLINELAGTGGGTWGAISGTLSNQTDLQAALDAKVDDSQISTFGASLIDDADAAAARTTLGLGTAATLSTTDIDERARDAIGTALVAGGNVTITVNDGGDTITISSTPNAGNAVLLETLTFNGSESTKTTSASFSGYKGIKLEIEAFKNTTGNGELRIEANGVTTTTNYYQQRSGGANAAVNAQVLGTVGYWGSMTIPSTTDYANASSRMVFEMWSHTETNVGKVLAGMQNFASNTSSGSIVILNYTNHWASQDAITSLRFFLASGNFDAKSKIRVYGLL